jgi:predicted dienelactone hydrolase
MGVAGTLAAFATTRMAWADAVSVGSAFDTLDLDWADAARQRAVPVRLYLPKFEARMPLVVFSHGIGGSRRGYSWLGQHFARSGIACLHVQHVGSDRALWMGSIFGLVERLQGAAQSQEAVARVQDLRFALDTLLADELAGRLDSQRIVAAGHSYGANTALLASGARALRDGAVVAHHRRRPRYPRRRPKSRVVRDGRRQEDRQAALANRASSRRQRHP